MWLVILAVLWNKCKLLLKQFTCRKHEYKPIYFNDDVYIFQQTTLNT